tara:strand:+ start:57 stop:599 length:543 start_codon:yes stop_codon:yes gene_type:complete
MIDFQIHTPETAPTEEVRTALSAMKERYGFVPNLGAVLAESPTTLAGMFALYDANEQGSLNPHERQLAYITASAANDCDYCVSAHSMLASKLGLIREHVANARGGQPLPDVRLEALRAFTHGLVTSRGQPGEEHLRRFLAAGYTKAQVFEIVAIVALKTLTNYANHLAQTAPNPEFSATV